MSTIPPSTNNSVFEETKIVVRQWLAANKQLDILSGHSILQDHAVYDISTSHGFPIFDHPSYAACVKFALEYERGE